MQYILGINTHSVLHTVTVHV